MIVINGETNSHLGMYLDLISHRESGGSRNASRIC